MSTLFYPTLTSIPRVQVGDLMFRMTLVNQYEEAMVVSILSPSETSESWTATVMTKNGIEFISGTVEHRSIHDWMPKGWVLMRIKSVGFHPKAFCVQTTLRLKILLRLSEYMKRFDWLFQLRGTTRSTCLGVLV